MSNTIEVKTIDINKDIIKSEFGFKLEAELAKDYISNNVLSITKHTLIIFDFRSVVISYHFTMAFSDLYNKTIQHDYPIDIVFLVDEDLIEYILLGLLESLGIKHTAEDGYILDYFISKGKKIKIQYKENGPIMCIGEKDPNYQKVYNYIFDKNYATSDEIHNAKVVEEIELLAPILLQLVKDRFVYKIENTYYSIDHFINRNK